LIAPPLFFQARDLGPRGAGGIVKTAALAEAVPDFGLWNLASAAGAQEDEAAHAF